MGLIFIGFILHELLFLLYFYPVGFYDSFPMQLGRCTGLETRPTGFSCLLIGLSLRDISCTNIRLFSFTLSKSDSFVHTLRDHQITYHQLDP